MSERARGQPVDRTAPGVRAGLSRDCESANVDRLRPGRWIAGVDVGGTNLRVGMVPFEGGTPAAVVQAPTRPCGDPAAVVARIVAMIRESMAGVGAEGVMGVGIGAPGPLDRNSGVVIETPNLGWRNVPIRDMVASELGLPAVLDNDANCAAFAEWWLGAGRGADRLIGLTLGTGIGGGVILGGEVYHGASDAAGEVGHMSVAFDGRLCACGSRGCVEAYASGPAIAARAAEGIARGANSTLSALAEGDPVGITAETVCEAAAAGDHYAIHILTETARILGVALANLIHLFNPEVIVIGGGVAAAGESLFKPLRAEAERRAFRSATAVCRIVPADFPGTGGVIGAAGIFKRAVHGNVRAGVSATNASR